MLIGSFSAQARPSLLEKFGFDSADSHPEVDQAFAFDAVVTGSETMLAGWMAITCIRIKSVLRSVALTISRSVNLSCLLAPPKMMPISDYQKSTPRIPRLRCH